MIYTIQIKKPFNYLAGISQDKSVIQNYWDALPEEKKLDAELLKFESLSYPFWILEKNTFQFINEEELDQAIKNTKELLKDEEDTFNLYWIEKDFLPDEPERDEMGILKHEHFDEEKVKKWEENGMAYLNKVFNID